MHHVAIIGGGTAGITVAARLKRALGDQVAVTIVEPSPVHYYQPLFTLVGGGATDPMSCLKPTQQVIPKGCQLERVSVETIQADQKTLILHSKKTLSYDFLIICSGVELQWGRVEGLPQALYEPNVVSVYRWDLAIKTFEALKAIRGGHLLFTFPKGPIKCGGAPQKIMWLTQHYLEKHHRVDQAQIHFLSAGANLFGVDKYRPVFEQLAKERLIQTCFRHNLVKVDHKAQTATFADVDSGVEKTLPYDFLHVTPPMGVHGYLQPSGLLNDSGYVDVDPLWLQHKTFKNIYSLGDCAALPTGKTGAAVRKQAPVVVDGVVSQIKGRDRRLSYNGYSSCPVITGYGRLVLAEFDYAGKPMETFPFNQAKERSSMYLLKKYGLPWLYWHLMLRGLA